MDDMAKLKLTDLPVDRGTQFVLALGLDCLPCLPLVLEQWAGELTMREEMGTSYTLPKRKHITRIANEPTNITLQ